MAGHGLDHARCSMTWRMHLRKCWNSSTAKDLPYSGSDLMASLLSMDSMEGIGSLAGR